MSFSMPNTYTKRRGGFAGFFGGKKTFSESLNVSIPIDRPVVTEVEVMKQYLKKTKVKPPLPQFIEPARRAILRGLDLAI